MIGLLLVLAPLVWQDEGERAVVSELAREDVFEPLERAVAYLLEKQNDDGSWGTLAPESVLELGFALESYRAWPVASQALACLALASVEETPERRAGLERALDWLCETRMPARGDDWDVDHVWSALYGFTVLVELSQDERFAQPVWREKLTARGKAFYDILRRYQAHSGGWAYYDDPPFIKTPTWATSFCTALVLPALIEARALGWEIEETVIERAKRYIRRCALPNGAYAYDWTPVTRLSSVEHINLIQGSLGRTQVCNWALSSAGDERITDDVIREGLQSFFDYHGFLDHVRTRPIPHEGFYANAGYFYFFGHYYAARAIERLPLAEREGWHRKLRPHLTKVQWASGGTSDFLATSYMITASTSYLILTLSAGLVPD